MSHLADLGDGPGSLDSTRIPLDRLTLIRWRRVVTDVMRSEVGGRVKLMLGALFALPLAVNGLNASSPGMGPVATGVVMRPSAFILLGIGV
ncbi:MAG TPA: hypothetical protein VMW19_03920 [Myxococcota bacterium]|nr:hypothetical protein [Myxococcota bacterium]